MGFGTRMVGGVDVNIFCILTFLIIFADEMIPRIKNIKPLSGHRLYAEFDDGRKVNYDLAEDIATLPNYSMLTEIVGLFEQARLDTSRTIVYWNDLVDLPSDTIYEYGVAV